MSRTREERETVIRRSAADETWTVWTCDPVQVRALERLGVPLRRQGEAVQAEVPRRWVRIRRPRRVSEEQRAAAAERLTRAREGR
jgi:hypothetical protein